MQELKDIYLRNRHDSFNDMMFIGRVVATLIESGNDINFGEYVAKCYENGHIKVLKSLGLYKTQGRGANKKIMVNDVLNLIIKTSIATNEEIGRNIVIAINRGFEILDSFVVSDFTEYLKLKESPARTEMFNRGTYIVFNPLNGLHKVGRSKNVFNRVQSLRNEFTKDLFMVGYCEKDCESKIHFEYRKKRMFGEWFSLSNDDVLDIFSNYNFKELVV